MSLPSRLANLSYTQLLNIAVEGCEGSPKLKNKADALVAQVAPLPSWCVDILLSPDLLLQFFSSLGLSEHAAAGVCTTWSHAYSRHLRRCRYVDPRRVRHLVGVPRRPNGLCMLPGGVLAIAASDDDDKAAMKFFVARNGTDSQALAACRASTVAARRFDGTLFDLALSNDGLLVCDVGASNFGASPGALYKFAKDGSMDELATVPVLATGYLGAKGFRRCAVHQQTQRIYAVADAYEGNQALILLDPNLRVVATAETYAGHRPVIDVAVHGDQVFVLTDSHHVEGSGLRLLDLDGRFLRTIAAGQFRNPWAVAVSHGRAFVVDDDNDDDVAYDDEGTVLHVDVSTVLHVVDIQSGYILQSTRIRNHSGASPTAILVDGDEIYISSYCTDDDGFSYDEEIVVLHLAGSEA